jgi:cell wall-associated NlpC family hydrolase
MLKPPPRAIATPRRHASQVVAAWALGLALGFGALAAQAQTAPGGPAAGQPPANAQAMADAERAEPGFGASPIPTAMFGQALFNQVRDRSTELVANAMTLLGVPYKRGGTDAETGLDCSAFVRKVFDQTIGLVLPRRSADQSKVGTPVEKTELKPGDLVFFNTLRRSFSHVGIYIGDGKFVHSPRAGGAVRVEDMRMAYWQKRYNGARRVAPDEAQTPPPGR